MSVETDIARLTARMTVSTLFRAGKKVLEMSEQFLSERRAAVRLGVARDTLRRHRKAGHIKPTIIGYGVFYTAAALERLKSEHLTKPRGRSKGK